VKFCNSLQRPQSFFCRRWRGFSSCWDGHERRSRRVCGRRKSRGFADFAIQTEYRQRAEAESSILARKLERAGHSRLLLLLLNTLDIVTLRVVDLNSSVLQNCNPVEGRKIRVPEIKGTL
jgi:hypothetical protein